MDSRFSTPRNNIMSHPPTERTTMSGMAALSYSRTSNIPQSVEQSRTPQSNCTAPMPYRGVPSIPPPPNVGASAPVGARPPVPIPPPPPAPIRLRYDENDGGGAPVRDDQNEDLPPLPEFLSAKSLYESNDKQMKIVFSSIIGVDGIESIDDDDRFHEVSKDKKFKKKTFLPDNSSLQLEVNRRVNNAPHLIEVSTFKVPRTKNWSKKQGKRIIKSVIIKNVYYKLEIQYDLLPPSAEEMKDSEELDKYFTDSRAKVSKVCVILFFDILLSLFLTNIYFLG